MAEAVGLALSGVALAGLFSTCMEIFEYLEQAKNWAKDIQLALTKVSLMKSRLDHWGATMAINSPGAEAHLLQDQWPTEGMVIMDSLMGIRDILRSTNHMCRRYHHHYQSSSEGAGHLQSQLAYEGQCQNSSLTSRAVCLYPNSPWRVAYLKAAWVLQDRKKFQALIGDFDFLLSNLEKIGEPLHQEIIMASRATKGSKRATSIRDYPVTSGNNTSLPSEIFSINGNPLQLFKETSEMSPATQNSDHMHGHISSFPNGHIPPEYNTGPRNIERHVFLNVTAQADADIGLGDYYQGGHVPATQKGHNYVNVKAESFSTVRCGNTDGGTSVQIARDKLKARQEQRDKERQEERDKERAARKTE